MHEGWAVLVKKINSGEISSAKAKKPRKDTSLLPALLKLLLCLLLKLHMEDVGDVVEVVAGVVFLLQTLLLIPAFPPRKLNRRNKPLACLLGML